MGAGIAPAPAQGYNKITDDTFVGPIPNSYAPQVVT